MTYKLSYRDLVEMMAERHVDVVHTTIMRWVQRYVPEFEKRGHRVARSMGTSWRIDEPSTTRKGQWVSLYRGVDNEGQTIDFVLSAQRDSTAAKRFLPQAIKKRGVPEKITLDGDAASHVDGAELQEEAILPRASTTRGSS